MVLGRWRRRQAAKWPLPARDPSVPLLGLHNVLWSWRPRFLSTLDGPRVYTQLPPVLRLDEHTQLSHQVSSEQVILLTRPIRAERVPLRFESFVFADSALCLSVTLPPEGGVGRAQGDLIAVVPDLWQEAPRPVICRFHLTLEGAPLVVSLPLQAGIVVLDLRAHLPASERLLGLRVELLFEAPQLTAFELRDLTFLRYGHSVL